MREMNSAHLITLLKVSKSLLSMSIVYAFHCTHYSIFNKNKLLQRRPIIIPRDYTATDLEEEHRMAYWREDIGINLHHWHWHLVYPFTSTNRAIVAKDRRGELFFYMHQQIIARYVPKNNLIHMYF